MSVVPFPPMKRPLVAILRGVKPDEVDRRSCTIDIPVRGVGANQAVEIPRFELVRLARHGLDVADAIIACAGLEHGGVERQCRQRRVAARQLPTSRQCPHQPGSRQGPS